MPINNDGLAKDPHTHLHTGEVPSICLGYSKRIAQVWLRWELIGGSVNKMALKKNTTPKYILSYILSLVKNTILK